MSDNGFQFDQTTPGGRVAQVMEATDKPEVSEAYDNAHRALKYYGALLAKEGVHGEQVAVQVMVVALDVVIKAMQ